MKFLIFTLIGSFLGLILFLAWASYPWSLQEKVVKGEVIHVEPDVMVNNEDRPSVIKVMTWNIGYLYGLGSEGPGYEPRDKAYFDKSIKELAEQVHQWSPDILFLQEIDFDANRSANLNQAQLLAKLAGYPYVAEAISWEAHYIPFPYWPIKRHFGKMLSGGAVLSKYPILAHEVSLLEKPVNNPWWYNLFYLHRYFQQVQIELGDKKINILNLHLEAFDKQDRKNQIHKLIGKLKAEKIDIIAGDFNMVPASAMKKSKFLDSTDDYENDTSYELMNTSGLSEVIPERIYSADESRFFTFPSPKPDRRLDYIWYQPWLKMIKAEVLPSASSDHLPLMASFQIAVPDFNPYSQ